MNSILEHQNTEPGRNTRSEKRRIRRKRNKRNRQQKAQSAKPAGVPGLVSDHTSPSHSHSDSGKSRTNSLERQNLPAYIAAGSKMPSVRSSGKMPKRPVSEHHQRQPRRGRRGRNDYRVKPAVAAQGASLPRASEGRQSLPLDGYGLNLNLYAEGSELRPSSMQNRDRRVSERSASPALIDVCGASRSESPDQSAIEFKEYNSAVATSEMTRNISKGTRIRNQPQAAASPQQEMDFDICQELEGLGSQVDMLGVALHKAKTESKHYQQMLHMVKNDMGQLLQRSYHMLQQARVEAQTYKAQLLELRRQWAREKNLARAQPKPEPIAPELPEDLTGEGKPVEMWWVAGVTQLLDEENDEKIDRESDDSPPPHPRATIGTPLLKSSRSEMFDAFDKFVFV